MLLRSKSSRHILEGTRKWDPADLGKGHLMHTSTRNKMSSWSPLHDGQSLRLFSPLRAKIVFPQEQRVRIITVQVHRIAAEKKEHESSVAAQYTDMLYLCSLKKPLSLPANLGLFTWTARVCKGLQILSSEYAQIWPLRIFSFAHQAETFLRVGPN